MYDEDDPEELHHTQYMQSLVIEAGLRGKLVPGVKNLSFKDGLIVDSDGEQIKVAWKTWSYDTILTKWNGQSLRTEGKVSLMHLTFNILGAALRCAIASGGQSI